MPNLVPDQVSTHTNSTELHSFLETNWHHKKSLPAAACGKPIYKHASVSLGEETTELSTYLLALLRTCIQRKFGVDIQKITMTPTNAKVSHIAAPEVCVLHKSHMARCTSAAIYQEKLL